MNIQEEYFEKMWSIINESLHDEELMLSSHEQDNIEQIMEDYHQDKLKLLGIPNVLKRTWCFDYIGEVYTDKNGRRLGVPECEEIEAYDEEHAKLLFEKMHPDKSYDHPY